MKKIFLFAVAAMMSLCINAQMVQSKQAPAASLKAPWAMSTNMKSSPFSKQNVSKNVAKTATLAENERLIGLYTTDYYDPEGYGLASFFSKFPLDIPMGTVIDAASYSKITDGKLKSIRFALSFATTVKSVDVYKILSTGAVQKVVSQPLSNTSAKAGWNTVELSEPIALSQFPVALMIGYTYAQINGNTESAYPVSVNGNVITGDSWLFYGSPSGGSGEGWYSLSSYGALCVQGIVECNNLPEIDIVLSNFETDNSIYQAGSTLQYAYSIQNFGSGDITSYEVNVSIDGKVLQTVTEKDQAVTTALADYVGKLTLPADLSRGSHTLTAELVKVNGAAPTVGTEDDKVSSKFTSFYPTDIVQRQKYLVEESTSHSCTYCPYGAAVIENMLEKSDELAVACIHGNQQSKDPFNTAECESLFSYFGITGFPSACFNRIYFGQEDGVCPTIGYNPQYQSQAAEMFLEDLQLYSAPAFASVNIEKTLDGNNLTIKVSGKGGDSAKEILDGYSLTVYICEDSLVYRQLNLGTWVNNYVHNHVLRDVVTAVNGDAINWTSDSEYSNTFNVTLNSTWVQDHLSIIAFLSKQQPLKNADPTDMAVSNANILKFKENTPGPGPDPEPDPRVDAGLIVSAINGDSQIMGEAMSPNGNYVVGMNYATFGPVVWNTTTGKNTDYPEYEEGTFHAVNNDGLAVGDDGVGEGFAIAIKADGTKINLYREEGETIETDWGPVSTGDAGSSAYCVSADGNTIGGFYFNSAYETFPCLWDATGARTKLAVPTSTQAGMEVNGAEVRYMTPDANVLLGMLIDNMGTWPAAIWRKNAQGAYDCTFIGKDYWEEGYQQGKPYMVFSPSGLSENGEWVALQVQEEFDDWDFSVPQPALKAARLNLTTNKLEVLTMPAEESMAPTSIANDGTMLAYTSVDGMIGRAGYIWKAGETDAISLDDMLNNTKGMPEFNGNVPCTISADTKKIQGFGFSTEADIFSYIFDWNAYTTDIKCIKPAAQTAAPASERIYTVSGQQVRNMTAPGIYIVNGKKVLVK